MIVNSKPFLGGSDKFSSETGFMGPLDLKFNESDKLMV
jgi:hypothetical protein